jgi:hypothetical protein
MYEAYLKHEVSMKNTNDTITNYELIQNEILFPILFEVRHCDQPPG